MVARGVDKLPRNKRVEEDEVLRQDGGKSRLLATGRILVFDIHALPRDGVGPFSWTMNSLNSSGADRLRTIPPLERAQKRNPGVTEIVKIPNRGHPLRIDHGWREVAQTALDFVNRFA